jgi:fibronectin-binding autotransporter adhesin
MATLYWGGGTGTWDGFTITHWYTDFARITLSTRAPSAVDDVIFDSASNATAYTVTISNNTTVCRSCTIAGPATGNLTLAGTTAWYIYGDLTLPATGLTRTFTGGITFYGSGNITTNAVTLASTLTFAGTGTYTLQGALTTSAITINAGTLNTNNQNLTLSGNISAAAGTTAGTLTLGSSTVNLVNISPNAPLVINAGTSNITSTSTQPFIGGGTNYTGNTFYNVTFSSSVIALGTIYGNNTFNNLTFTTRSTANISPINLYGNQTVTGTLTIAGQSSVNRYILKSNIVGTTRTLTVGTVAALTDVDFQDITVAGASSPWSGTRLGDAGGNTNITFPAAKTVYWNLVAGGAWSSTAWATSSGGAVSAANFPLAQDTAIIDDTGLTAGNSITLTASGAYYFLKTLTSTRTTAWGFGAGLKILGDLTLTASTTCTATLYFAGRVTQNLTMAGNSTSGGITIESYNNSVTLADNLTMSNTLQLTSGGFNTNSKTVSLSTVSFTTTDAGLFSLTLGSSAFSCGSFGSTSATAPTMTVSAGTSTITLANSNAIIGFSGQTLTWNNVTYSLGPGSTSIQGNNTFNNLTLTSPTSAIFRDFTVYGNQTITGTLALAGGSSVTQRLGIISDTPGTQRTITAATVTGLTDIDFRDIAAAGASAPWSGTRLGNCLGNSGITFVAGANKYWNLAGTQDWSATGWATSSGGSPAANNFPLAQDTAIFDDTGSASTVTVSSACNIGTVNMSSRTSAMTIAGGGTFHVYGNFTYGSGITITYNGLMYFRGTSTQTFITASKTILSQTTIWNPSCSFKHGDAFTSQAQIGIQTGSYSTQNYNVTADGFNGNSVLTRNITFGTSTLNITGNTFILVSTGLTFSGSSSTINLSYNTTKTFTGGGQTFGTVSSTAGTTGPLTIVGSNTFTTLSNTAYTYMIWTQGTTQTITNFNYTGASGSVVRFYTTIPGQQATLKTASSAIGVNSTDGGNNTGLSFSGTANNYFYVKDVAYLSSSTNNSNFFTFFLP